MTPDQERHLARIKARTASLLDAKYRRGQKEHDSNLWRQKVMPDLLDEVIDMVAYGLTLEEHIVEIKTLCAAAERGDVDATVVLKRIGEIL
jgi:hypothetical protein